MNGILLLALLALSPCAPTDRAVIGEILYDAAGDDGGNELVELFNPTAHDVELSGARLESGPAHTLQQRGSSNPSPSIRFAYVTAAISLMENFAPPSWS